jgi:hypothetical protein
MLNIQDPTLVLLHSKQKKFHQSIYTAYTVVLSLEELQLSKLNSPSTQTGGSID